MRIGMSLARGATPDAPKLPSMGSAHPPAGGYLIALSDHVLDGGVEVWETLSELAHEPLYVLGPALQHRTIGLMGQLPVEDLVRQVEVALVTYFLDITAKDCLILLFRH